MIFESQVLLELKLKQYKIYVLWEWETQHSSLAVWVKEIPSEFSSLWPQATLTLSILIKTPHKPTLAKNFLSFTFFIRLTVNRVRRYGIKSKYIRFILTNFLYDHLFWFFNTVNTEKMYIWRTIMGIILQSSETCTYLIERIAYGLSQTSKHFNLWYWHLRSWGQFPVSRIQLHQSRPHTHKCHRMGSSPLLQIPEHELQTRLLSIR
jgi:hypothetical protein